MSVNDEPKLPEVPGPERIGAEHLPTGTIYGVLAGALLIFAVGVWLADGMRVRRTHRLEHLYGKEPTPAHVGEAKIGMLEQNLFELQHRWSDEKRAQLERLHGYGWADRSRNEIHIPIEQAMQQAAGGQR